MGYKQYCKCYEKIENYEKAKADGFKGWQCHHRLETHFASGERRPVDITKEELIALGMYYHRPAEELIFLRRVEHVTLHHKGKQLTEEHKRKISETKKGKPKSEEHKRKMSEARKGKRLGRDNPFYGKTHSEESKKKMSEAKKGKQLTEETKKKLSEARKGKHWFNNGKINVRAKECPPGFVPGRLK